LQEEEAAFAKKKGYSRHENPQPLYTEQDARSTFPLFRPFGYDERISISDRVDIVYRDAGHLLGSAIVEVFIKGDNQTKKIVFSGDLGRYKQAMLNPPTTISEADILLIESTYGDRENPGEDPAGDIARVVNDTFARGGVLVIPAFAVGRTQTLMLHLRRLMQENAIPDEPVYVDSRMAISATCAV